MRNPLPTSTEVASKDRSPCSTRGTLGTAVMVFVWLLIGVVPPMQAQPTAQPDTSPADVFDDRIVVREATVFVRVRSRRGPVTDLDRDRFSARIQGAEIPIVAFEELRVRPTKKRRSAGPDAVPELLLGRNLLVVFDGRFTPRPYLLDAVRSVRRSLDELGPDDRMAVVLWTGRAQLILPFTNDPSQLEAAFIYLAARLNANRREAAEAAQLLGALSSEPSTRLGLGLRAELTRRSPSVADSVDFSFVNRVASFDPAEALQAAELAINNELSGLVVESNEALADLARSLSDVSGPRHAVLFGKGVPGFQDLIQGRTAWDAGTISSVTRSFNEMTYRLRGNGWVVDTIDVTGVGGRSTAVSMADSAPRTFDSQSIAATPQWVERGGLAGNDSDSLFLIAEQTGGDMYDNRNSLRDALRQSLEASSHAYRLVVQIPDTVRLDDRRGAVRMDIDVRDLPVRASVKHSFGADWAIPAHLRKASEVENAHAELVGTRTAQPLPPLLARLTVHRGSGPSDSRLHRARVFLDADAALFDGARNVSVIAVASPVDADGGDGSIFDLWTEHLRLERADTEAVLISADLLVPCSGARIRLRLATDRGSSWVAERVVGDSCSEAPPSDQWNSVRWVGSTANAVIVSEPGLDSRVTGSRARFSVLAGQSIEVAVPTILAETTGESVELVLAPLEDEARRVERRALAVPGGREADEVTYLFAVDVEPGHYLVRLATAPPSTAILVSVF